MTGSPPTRPPGRSQAEGAPVSGGEEGARAKSLTIGAVCKALAQEFPDISISKIRYLEDQKLLDPAAHPGRLPPLHPGRRGPPAHDPAPAARRVPAAARDPPGARRGAQRGDPSAGDRRIPADPGWRGGRASHLRRASVSVREDSGALYSLEEVLEETKAEAKLVRELEEYGVVKGELRGGVRYFDETEREIIAAVAELARYGVGGRNLRVFRSSADREASLLQQILAPGAALAQPAAAQGGPGRAREPRRGGHAPEAPAADPRPAQDRPLMERRGDGESLRSLIREIPDFPQPGIGFKDITPLMADAAARSPTRCAGWPSTRGRCASTASSPPRRAASCSARRSRSSSARASCSRASRASCRIETVSAEYVLEYGAGAARAAHRRACRGAARARARRPAGHRRARRGAVRARRAARRRGRRLRLPDRARVPRRPRAARAARVHALLTYES